MNINPFRKDDLWFKGNIHSHSTLSDGKKTPEELVESYRIGGYAFLSISDHELFTDLSNLDREDFILLPSIERKMVRENKPYMDWKGYHFGGIQGSNNTIQQAAQTPLSHGTSFEIPVAKEGEHIEEAQKMINMLNDTGNIVILNHPQWSRLELEDFEKLEGLCGIEIYNSFAAVDGDDEGAGAAYWDSLLRKGARIWGIAADDTHSRRSDNHIKSELKQGWIVVKAPSLSKEAIILAIEEGSFYSSTGPEILSFEVKNNVVSVTCSEVNKIEFITYEHHGHTEWAQGESLTEASYKLNGDEKYVRVVCVELNGKTAWSNPIFLDW